MRLIQAFAHPPPSANAQELVDAVTRNARMVARRLAEDHGDRLQAATESGHTVLPQHDPATIRAQLGGGRPLDGAVRRRMQQTFGQRFDSVRIHDDAGAARLSAGLGARAFTLGEHIAFAAGQYRPGTIPGETLIAHELSHTLQQGAGRVRDGSGGAHDDELEQEADRAASVAIAAPDVVPDVGFTTVPQANEVGSRVQRFPVIVAGALELGADALIVTEVAAVSTTEVIVVDGAVTVAADVGAPLVVDTLAPTALESVAPAALETMAPEAVATSSSSLSTAAKVLGTGLAATTLSSDSPTGEEQDKRRDCMRDNPYAIPCEDELSLDEQVIEWIMGKGYGFESLGECEGFRSHLPGEVNECNGAPGETWHCAVKPYYDPISRTSKPARTVSVFSCLCCRADGTVGFEWRGRHWSGGDP